MLSLLRDSKTTKEGLRREVSNHIVHEEAVIEVRDSDQRVNHIEGKIGNRIRVFSVKGTQCLGALFVRYAQYRPSSTRLSQKKNDMRIR